MPTFTAVTTVAYQKDKHVQTVTLTHLDEFIKHCKARLAEEELILSVVIHEGMADTGKILWDSTEPKGKTDG